MRIALVAPLAELWRNRAGCVLAGGGASPARAPGYFIRERRIGDGGRACRGRRAKSLTGVRDHLGSTLATLREVLRHADVFDIIHFHVDLLPQALFHARLSKLCDLEPVESRHTSRLDLRLQRHGRDVTLNLLRRQGDAKVMLVK